MNRTGVVGRAFPSSHRLEGTDDGRDEVRSYLREVDDSMSRVILLGDGGRRLLDAVAERLATLGAIRWEPVGSTCCATSVAGFSDVDMLAVFLDPIRHGIDDSIFPYSIAQLRDAIARGTRPPPVPGPGAAFDQVADRLADLALPGAFDLPVRDFPAVRFPSRTAEPSVEVVPGIEADILWDQVSTRPSSGLVRVAFPAYRNRWLGTEPRLHSGVLDFGRSGTDYTVRELIRLLKLVKYRRDIPVRSYFLEVFCLRWLEGSELFPAKSIADIVEQHSTAWSFRRLGLLVDDVADLLTSLAGYLNATASGDAAAMIDITTPEKLGTIDACADPEQARVAAELTESVAAEADVARISARVGDPSSAVTRWRAILSYES